MSNKQQGVLNFDRSKVELTKNAGAGTSGAKIASNAHMLHNAAKQLTGQSLGRPRLKTKDVVGYLLGHGARAWRASFPVAIPRVRVMMPNGHLAVKIKFNASH